jgi:hypothetical protein
MGIPFNKLYNYKLELAILGLNNRLQWDDVSVAMRGIYITCSQCV